MSKSKKASAPRSRRGGQKKSKKNPTPQQKKLAQKPGKKPATSSGDSADIKTASSAPSPGKRSTTSARAAGIRSQLTSKELKHEVGRILKSNRWYWEHMPQGNGVKKMTPKLRAALIALATALADEDEATPAAVEPPKEKPKAPPKEKPVEKPKEEAKPNLLAQARETVTKFGEVHGREATRKKLDEFTTGTVADVPADKLADLIKAFSAPPAERPLV